MQPVTIRKEIEIAAPASQVWPYVGTAAGLRQWWQVELILEEETGGYCEERGVREGQPYRLTGRVTAYEPPYRLALTLEQRVGSDQWPARTEVEITLAEAAAGTRVIIHHHAFAAVLAPTERMTVATSHSWPGPAMALPGYHRAPNLPLSSGSAWMVFQTLPQWEQGQVISWERNLLLLQTLLVTHVKEEIYA